MLRNEVGDELPFAPFVSASQDENPPVNELPGYHPSLANSTHLDYYNLISTIGDCEATRSFNRSESKIAASQPS